MKLQPFQLGEWVTDRFTPTILREVLEVREWEQSPSGWVARCRAQRPGMGRVDWIETSRLTRAKAPTGSPDYPPSTPAA